MPLDSTTRHYVGPEQTTVPPMPSLPPAEELSGETITTITAPTDVLEGFNQWASSIVRRHPEAAANSFLLMAFQAGVAFARQQIAASARAATKPSDELEGTIESRTIIAALHFFKDQVLVHGPEEVSTGEWLHARDIDALIASLKRR